MRWVLMAGLLAGCVGSPIHRTMRYNSVQSSIEANNYHLVYLHLGMSKDDAISLMGLPELSEGYAWGAVMLYRTAMTSGVYGTADSDFTPVVFDPSGQLIGWGRNFFAEQVRRYELTIKER